jgi:ribonuclease HI
MHLPPHNKETIQKAIH